MKKCSNCGNSCKCQSPCNCKCKCQTQAKCACSPNRCTCPPGAPGAPGIQGPTGPAGSIGTIAGSFPTVDDLIANEHNHQPGNFYLVGKDLWFWSEEQGQWENAGPIGGPPGPQGPAGPPGAPGAPGHAGLSPVIGSNGNWYVGGVDTGVPATGPQGPQGDAGLGGNTPAIGANGNWYIGGADTGIPATGPQGPQGDAGSIGTLAGSFPTVDDLIANEHNHQPGNFYLVGKDLWFWSEEQGQWENAGPIEGPPGPKGDTGTPGATPNIGPNGNWYLQGIDTGVPARGPQGPAGQNGQPGLDGQPGQPGATPHIGPNGNWYLNDTDTGVPATGPQGPAGTSPHIGPNGNWFINNVDTGVPATGPQGEPGQDGDGGTGGGQRGLQAELINSEGLRLYHDDAVPFNNVLLNTPPSQFSYDPSTGTFTINQPGIYNIDWWLGVINAWIPDPHYVEVGLRINGVVQHIVTQTGTVFANISGHDLINITTVPTQIQLVVLNQGDITLNRGNVQAGLLITG